MPNDNPLLNPYPYPLWPTSDSPVVPPKSPFQYKTKGSQTTLVYDDPGPDLPSFDEVTQNSQPPELTDLQRTYGMHLYATPINLLNAGLNTLSGMHNQKQFRKDERKNSFLSQQPYPMYLNNRMMYGDNQMFAEKGGEMDYAAGGPIKPIYVKDPGDARLKAYNDSLNLYNYSYLQAKNYFGVKNPDKYASYDKVTALKNMKFQKYLYEGSLSNSISDKYGVLISKIQNRTGYNPIGERSVGEGSNYIFKKPVQPVKLEKEKPVFTETPTPLNPNYTAPDPTTGSPFIDATPVPVNTPNSTTKTNPTGPTIWYTLAGDNKILVDGVNKYMTFEEFDKYMDENPNNQYSAKANSIGYVYDPKTKTTKKFIDANYVEPKKPSTQSGPIKPTIWYTVAGDNKLLTNIGPNGGSYMTFEEFDKYMSEHPDANYSAKANSIGYVYDPKTKTTKKMKKGGSIHIDPKNKGKFTAWANAHGIGIQEAASHILSHKDKYSSTLIKRANFARNASKWKHEEGGEISLGQEIELSDNQMFAEDGGMVNYAQGGSWTDYLNPMNWGVEDYSEYSKFANAYRTAKSDGKEEFLWNGKRYNTKYAGTPRQEVGMYGVNGKKVAAKQVENPYIVNYYRPKLGYYLPGHISAASPYGYSIDYSKTGNAPYGVESSYHPEQGKSSYLVYGADSAKFRNTVSKLPLGDRSYLYDDEEIKANKFNNSAESTWNLFTYNCADGVCEAFGIPRGGKVTHPWATLIKISEKYPTMDITGRDYMSYIDKINAYRKMDKENVLKQSEYFLGIVNSPEFGHMDRKLVVETIQKALSEYGFKLPKSTTSSGSFDGVLGPETKAALEKFHKEHSNKKMKKGGEISVGQELELSDEEIKYYESLGYKFE